MSDPRTDYNDPLYGAIQELTSAMSALNMPAEPMEGAGADGFLVDNDATAKHAHDHMSQAMQYLIALTRQ